MEHTVVQGRQRPVRFWEALPGKLTLWIHADGKVCFGSSRPHCGRLRTLRLNPKSEINIGAGVLH